jgi:cytochrome c-type biogenesis protein
MLPIYISYFVDKAIRIIGGKNTKMIFKVIALFWLYGGVHSNGSFFGNTRKLLSEYQTIVNIVSGVIVILFGLSYLEVSAYRFLRECIKGISNGNCIGFFVWSNLFGKLNPLRRSFSRFCFDVGIK